MRAISVIVPVYKVEPYLRRCVDSILAQSFENFDLILVDDGSPDGCPAICDEYTRKDNRVVVIHQPNGGLSAARNAGIDWAITHSKSQWIAFVDSDDWVHPQYLELLHQAAQTNQADISICGLERTSSYHIAQSIFITQTRVMGRVEAQEALYSLWTEMAIACNKLYKKELFAQLRYPVGKIHEDEFLTWKVLWAADGVVYFDTPLYYYFQRADSIMGCETPKTRLDAAEAFLERAEFYEKHGLTNLAGKASLCAEPILAEFIFCNEQQSESAEFANYCKKMYRKLLWHYIGIWPAETWVSHCLFAFFPRLWNVTRKVYRWVRPRKNITDDAGEEAPK